MCGDDLREKEAELERGPRAPESTQGPQRHIGADHTCSGDLRHSETRSARAVQCCGANKALKEAVTKIVLDPRRARLAIYWHHSAEATDDVRFVSRHAPHTFDEGDPVTVNSNSRLMN